MKEKMFKVVLCVCALIILLLAIFLPKATWAYIVELVLAFAMMGLLMSKTGKKYNVAKVILIAFIGLMILSWIIPAAYYSGEYIDQGRTQMGLFDMFNYPLTALSYFGYITLYIILVGGFYGVLHKIPAYRSFLDKIVKKFDKKKELLLSIIVVLIALLVSICGLHIGIALFVPFVVALIFLMGYDKITAALVTVGGVSAGLIGTTLASSNISVLTQTLGLKVNYNIWVRVVILLAAIAIVIFNVVVYVKRNLKNVKVVKKEVKRTEAKVEIKKTTKSSSSTKSSKKTTTKKSSKKKNNNKAALKDGKVIVLTEAETVESDSDFVPKGTVGKHSTWPVVTLFILLLVVLVLAFFSWDAEGLGIQLFNQMTKSVTNFELFKFPIFAKVLGTVNAFGAWTLTDMFVPLALVVLLLAFIYRMTVEEVLEGFVSGAKKAMGPAVVSVLLYGILVLVTYHPFQLVIYNTLISMTKGFNILTTTVTAILASLFNSDIAYTFQSVLPYYVTKVTNLKDFSIVGIIFTAMYGLTALVAPTSLVLMGILSYLKVSYKDWLKATWKLLVELFVVLLVVFIILALL
ncbi:MAG: hypothetical protein IJI58_03035 [Bacilli bacterium]|nr:hypothetical protein [Bacilli bacterium]